MPPSHGGDGGATPSSAIPNEHRACRNPRGGPSPAHPGPGALPAPATQPGTDPRAPDRRAEGRGCIARFGADAPTLCSARPPSASGPKVLRTVDCPYKQPPGRRASAARRAPNRSPTQLTVAARRSSASRAPERAAETREGGRPRRTPGQERSPPQPPSRGLTPELRIGERRGEDCAARRAPTRSPTQLTVAARRSCARFAPERAAETREGGRPRRTPGQELCPTPATQPGTDPRAPDRRAEGRRLRRSARTHSVAHSADRGRAPIVRKIRPGASPRNPAFVAQQQSSSVVGRRPGCDSRRRLPATHSASRAS